jgi:hypothetical protein
MKRKFFSVFVLLSAFIGGIMAQNPTFFIGDKIVNLGLGIGRTFNTGGYYASSFPPISISFEQGILDNVIDEKGSIGVGGLLGYTSYKWDWTGYGSNYGWKYTDIIIAARGAFHYALVDKLDTYTGLLLGYRIANSKSFGDIPAYGNYSASSGGVMAAWFAGGRYYFTDKFAGMAEIGYGLSYLTLGVSFKL